MKWFKGGIYLRRFTLKMAKQATASHCPPVVTLFRNRSDGPGSMAKQPRGKHEYGAKQQLCPEMLHFSNVSPQRKGNPENVSQKNCRELRNEVQNRWKHVWVPFRLSPRPLELRTLVVASLGGPWGPWVRPPVGPCRWPGQAQGLSEACAGSCNCKIISAVKKIKKDN